MTDDPDEWEDFAPSWWSKAVQAIYGQYYAPVLDFATGLVVFLGSMGAYGLYADLEEATQLLAGATFLLALFSVMAYRAERRWRA